ncbi:MAG TPA: N-acetylmuramoyl-L-alanine amidase [Candidatus Anoxymicrobiaceae bacterium]
MSILKKVLIASALATLLLAGMPVLGAAPSGKGAPLVCLDPGHGGEDSGANYNGVMEKIPNLDIALRVRPILQSLGYNVVMTRETDATVSLQQRCDIANAARADVFMSIHNNAYMTDSQGTETYSYYGASEGKKLATLVQQQVVQRIKLPDRGVKEAGFYVLHHTNMPSALVEGCFLTNPAEAKLLQNSKFRQKIADGVAAGIHLYLVDPGRFDEFLLLQNPDPERDAEVEVHYMRGDGVEEVYPELVPHGTRRTIHVDEYIFNKDVSAMVQSVNGVPVVAERAMYFNFDKGRGGTGAPGVSAPSTGWYLAEGSTDWGFTTYILVQNPSGSSNSVTMQFMRDDGKNKQQTFSLQPHSRFTLDCSSVDGFQKADFSVRLTSRKPVIVERAMYFPNHNGISGGHDSPGLVSPGINWYLAEGYTGGAFDTYILIQNPNSVPANAKVHYLLPKGATVVKAYQVAARSRRTIHVDDITGLSNTDVSFHVESDQPVAVERSMYFKYKGIGEGSNSTAVDAPSTTWYLAEGYTGPGFDTYVLLMNPGDTAANATLRFMREDGGRVNYPLKVPAHSRRTVRVNDVNTMSGVAFATQVDSDQPLVVERAKYYEYDGKSGGDAAMGVTQAATRWYFAEGCTR